MNKSKIVRMSLERFHEIINSSRTVSMQNVELEEQIEQLKFENQVLSKTASLEDYVNKLKASVSEQGMLINTQIQQIEDLRIKLFEYTQTIDNSCYVSVEPTTDQQKFEMYSKCTKEQLISMLIESNKVLDMVKSSINPYFIVDEQQD